MRNGNGGSRRSLTNVGGKVELGGKPDDAALLAHALDVPAGLLNPARTDMATEGEERAHVHGFHAYPARMHPVTAARLVESFAAPGELVLDPFCGSGTVLVEAMLQGRRAIGTDLNPLAVMLADLKTRERQPGELDALLDAAKDVAAYADSRRKERVGATQRYPDVDREAFDPHVLLELDGIRHGIYTEVHEALRDDLMLVLSAILVKLSRKASDTSVEQAPKRIAAGYSARLFVKKTEELVSRLRDLESKLPVPRPACDVGIDDAMQLGSLAVGAVDAVITSPPYVATYDYLEHHALRLRWLDLDAQELEHHELGSRREYAELSPHYAWERWASELHTLLLALSRVTRQGAAVVLLMADSAVGDAALPAEEIIADVARGTSLYCVARASQPRPHFHQATREAFRNRPRAEHALLLRRS